MAACLQTTRRAAKNFYYGIRLLPRVKRGALCAIYAWSRLCDDAVDAPAVSATPQGWMALPMPQAAPPPETAAGEGRDGTADPLARPRAVLQRAQGPGYARDADPVVHALGDAIRRFALPEPAFAAILRGMEMDLSGTRYETFDQLRVYCACVAGAVGELCLAVFGYTDPQAPALGVEMGVALQLTNILRDLREDLGMGRIYLPHEEIAAAGYSLDDLRALRRTPAFDLLLTQQVDRASDLFARSERLFAMVAPDARLCLMVLHGVYRALLADIAARPDALMSRRIQVSTARKLRMALGLMLHQRQVTTARVSS